MSEKKRDAGYRAALTGAKVTVRLLIYVCVILDHSGSENFISVWT